MSVKNITNKTGLGQYLLLLITMTLLLGACASTKRMTRIMPFGRDEVSDPDRVNVWPLLYQSNDCTSVLWPLFDMDDQGFALRPLVALEGKSVSVLGPLAGWDWDKDIWWVIPAYRFENDYGVFPLFGQGNKAGYIGPAYWLKEGGSVNGFGLFPLGYYGQKWGHVGPAFWFKEQPEDSVKSFGLFPLGYYGQKWGHAGPAFWFKEQTGESVNGFGIFPLGYYGQKWGYFGTAWWSFDDHDNLSKGGLFPILTLGTKVEQVGPVFWDNDNDDNTNFLTVLPLFHYEKKSNAFTFISPLGGRGWNNDRNARFTNIMGPLFNIYRQGEETTTHVLWPVFYLKTGPGVSRTRLFPLFTHDMQGATTKTSVLWPVFQSKRSPYMSSTSLFPLFSRKEQGSSRTTSVLLGTYKHKLDGDRRYTRMWPIFSDSNMGLNPDPVDYFTLYSNLRDDNASRIQIGTSLLYSMTRDRTGEITDWNALAGAINYRKENGSDKYNVLWYLYRMNRDSEMVNRDIFPFITWDTAPESSRFSFLSRFFSYERKVTGSRFHLLFIPMWNSIQG